LQYSTVSTVNPPHRDVPSLLGIWWFFVIASSVVGRYAASVARDADLLADLENAYVAEIARAAFHIGNCAFGLWLFWMIDRMQESKWAKVADSDSRRACPSCGEAVDESETACPVCGTALSASPEWQMPEFR
jgi:hypothetical protein